MKKYFEPHWLKDDEYSVYFKQLWLPDPSPIADSVRSNLSSILEHLLEWNRKKYGNLTHNIKRTRLKFEALHSQLSWSISEELKLES